MNLARRPIRSLLTVLGVTIGMTAVVGLLGLSGGIERALRQQFERLGHDLVLILPAASPGEALKPMELDLDRVRSVPGVAQAGGLLRRTLPVSTSKSRGFLVMLGLSPEMWERAEQFFSRFELSRGRLPSSGEVLLTQRAAQDLDLRVGDTLVISDREFRVSGVLSPTGDPRTEGALLMPLGELWDLTGEKDRLSLAWAKAQGGVDVEELAASLEEALARGGGRFQIQTSRRLSEIVRTVLRVLRAALAGIAAVALLVGGIGLMNTMYTAVLERTREIGVLTALGARRWQILWLYLIEAGLLGLLGGIFGVILGTGLAMSLAFLIRGAAGIATLSPMIGASLIGFSLLFSTGLGMLAGVLPARRAASLPPTEALRYE